MKIAGLVFSCFMFLSTGAGMARADDAATFNGMLALANKGDAEAQYHVGMMFNNGIGTGQDPRLAFGWFQKAASANDPLGAYKLGCYYAGQFPGIVTTDGEAALKYKLVAASAGYSLAQHDVAVIYSRQGKFEEAVKWLKLASAQGEARSLWGLSSSYHEGKGVPQDLSLAFAYFKLSLLMSGTGLMDSSKAVLDEMSARMSAADLDKAQLLVEKWKPAPTNLTLKAQRGISEAEAHLKAAE